ncbi:murein transglycosylase A [Gluconacetobacter entanii]|uniref:peptidoglycan lytic exotransglycosylase n=1 Tax=Gluconacetobacter entanii TaxID=108528 RepID=A0A318PUF9_9PROT|nr:murein transglycosylase A [Gluconacetobacter entanii]MBE7620059.1 murein transglycosylase [Komagataeibacter sp. FXV2]MCE2579927.1 murein transglycosylase A [Komagataeibacter sp. FNDCR1]MBY4641652.1 murein transglycosylase A [Gluconacetobacter entanii]MCW4582129.1 murein transglycosylase A [Gluconacetobacter entanii]MCW4585512.1 murein transglycosylase A [Gluconacetobacter entanii]
MKPVPVLASALLCACYGLAPQMGLRTAHAASHGQNRFPAKTKAISFAKVPGWDADSTAQALSVFVEECHKLGSLPADSALGDGTARVGNHVGDWLAACDAARRVAPDSDAAARDFFQTWFRPYRIGTPDRQGTLFTGYYEPEIRGSLKRGGIYQTPVYRRPADLQRVRDAQGHMQTGRWEGKKFVPYATRAQIDGGALAHHKLELLWVADPVDLFFLQVQGAGRVRLPNEKVVRLSFDGHNGQPYVPLGQVMVQKGYLEEGHVSLTAIRAWLEEHPEQARSVMEQNPNYVFFTELPSDTTDVGTPGALGVPLTPGRSLAVDRHAIPLGAPVWIDTAVNASGHVEAWKRLGFAQDLSRDVKGTGSVDLYLGWGPEAAQDAAAQHSVGQLVVLLPRKAAQDAGNGRDSGDNAP